MDFYFYQENYRHFADDKNFYFRDYEDENDSGELGKIYDLTTNPKKPIFKLRILEVDLFLYSDDSFKDENGEIKFKGNVFTKQSGSLLYKINVGNWMLINKHIVIGINKLGLFLAEPVSEIKYDYSVVIYPNIIKDGLEKLTQFIINTDTVPQNSELYIKWDNIYNKMIQFYKDDEAGLNEFLKTKNLFICNSHYLI